MANKHLKCEFTVWEGNPVVSKDIQDLWQSVPIADKFSGKKFFEPLKESIIEHGLRFPILVVECTLDQLKQQKQRFKDKILDLPPEPESGYIYAVWGGSNRLGVARQLGYTSVDCVIIPGGNFNQAFNYQSLHRRGYTSLYNTGKSIK